MKILKICSLFIILLSFSACESSSPNFIIEGNINGASNNDTIYLIKRELQSSNIIDSSTINKDGFFRFKEKAKKYPDFYIIKYKNQQINIAIDSTETIKIKTTAERFSENITIEGSNSSADIQKIILMQQDASKALKKLKEEFARKEISIDQYRTMFFDIINNYKTSAQEIILKNLAGPAAYFAIFQKDSQFLFFDPYDKQDYKMYAAVANSWDKYYPQSPRSKQLKAFTLEALKIRKDDEAASKLPLLTDTISASNYFNIDLPDINNKIISLFNSTNKYTILDFTVYIDPNSPSHNILLNNVYNKYRDQLNIYQVSFDTDLHFWRNAASNIPWIAVHSGETSKISLLKKFNITTLPTTFLLDKNGTIIKRLSVNKDIEAQIKKEM